MPINVKFSSDGFYHAAFGRLGRGKASGKIYTLPDEFAAPGMLPSRTEILTQREDLDAALEDAEQTKPVTPKVADEDALRKARSRIAEQKSPKRASTRKV